MVILIYRAQLIRLMMVMVCFWMIRVTRRYPQFYFFFFLSMVDDTHTIVTYFNSHYAKILSYSDEDFNS